MEPLSPNDPRAVGEFQLRARLGAGGMGRVYLGFSPAGRAVAVKVVQPELAGDPEFISRFAREVAAARTVSGMYTAPVVAAGLDDHPPWLATTYVPGPSLADVGDLYGPLPEDAVWRLGAGLAEALHAIHASGLVHRDLKPANVLLAIDGPRVIDFGISRALDGAGGLTSTGIVLGTAGYMSPEQAQGIPVGPASDVFSLGCVLAYAATGAHPFGGGSPATVLYRIVSGQADLTRVPPRLRELVTECLVKDPARRPPLPALASALTRGGPPLTGSFSSFWPEAVAEVIRRSVPEGAAYGAPSAQVPAYAREMGSPVGAAASPSRADDPAPVFTPGGYTPTAASQSPPATQYSPSGQYSPPEGGRATGTAPATASAVYAGPSYGALPPPGQVPGLTSPRGAAVRRRLRGAPVDVRAAVAVMAVGAVATVSDLVLSYKVRAALLHVAQRHPYQHVGEDAKTTAAKVAIYALLPFLLGTIGWLVSAVVAARGRPGAPTLAGVLFGLDTIVTLVVLFGLRGDRRIDTVAVIIWLLGLVAVILLHTRVSRSYLNRA